MRKLKKTMLFIILIVVALGLTACFLIESLGESFSLYYYEGLSERVIRVELIDYRPFDFNKIEVIEILQDVKIGEFLIDLKEVGFREEGKHFFPMGISIRLLYENGDFDVICYNIDYYSGSFYSNGDVKNLIGSASDRLVRLIINKYFNRKI